MPSNFWIYICTQNPKTIKEKYQRAHITLAYLQRIMNTQKFLRAVSHKLCFPLDSPTSKPRPYKYGKNLRV